MNEALQYLQSLPATNDQQRTQLIIAEAQLLREIGRLPESVSPAQQWPRQISRFSGITLRPRAGGGKNR